MQSLTDRPAYVTFEYRPVENRAASIEAGHPVFEDVVYAVVTPAGSKDRMEFVASEWFERLKKSVDGGRFPRPWLQNYEAVYQAWLKDEEPPVNGTHIKNWTGLTPSQYRMLRDLRLITVEDVAAMNEEALSRYGMGARALKQRATDWLQSSRDVGATAEELSALKTENATLRTQLTDLARKLDSLMALAEASNRGKVPAKAEAI